MPTWEVDNIVSAINEIRNEEERIMKAASPNGKIGFK